MLKICLDLENNMIKINFNSKGQNLAINKVLVIILILFTIVGVLFFIFKTDINQYLRNLPGYGSGEEISESKEIIQESGTVSVSKECPQVIALVREFEKKPYIYLPLDENKYRKTKLYFQEEFFGTDEFIWYDSAKFYRFGKDPDVAILSTDGRISVTDFYDEIKEDLDKLNGAKYERGINKICKA